MTTSERVEIRNEHSSSGSRHLEAYMRDDDLVIAGQDLGGGSELMSGDGEYEWFHTYKRPAQEQVVQVLGGQPGDDVLDTIRQCVAADQDVETMLRTSDIPHESFSC